MSAAKFIKSITLLHGFNNSTNFSIDVDKQGAPVSDICLITEGVYDGIYAVTLTLDNGKCVVISNPVNVLAELCDEYEYNAIQQRRKEYRANPPQPQAQIVADEEREQSIDNANQLLQG